MLKQFTLRTLVLTITLVAVFAASYREDMARERSRRLAFNTVECGKFATPHNLEAATADILRQLDEFTAAVLKEQEAREIECPYQ